MGRHADLAVLKAFIASFLGSLAGLGLLSASAFFIFSGEISLSGNQQNFFFTLILALSFLASAAVWGALLLGFQFALKAVKATLLALIAGLGTSLLFTLSISGVADRPLSNSDIWLYATIVACFGSAAAGCIWGGLIGGKRLAIRSITVGCSITVLICAFPTTPILLLYLHSVVLSLTYIPFFVCTLLAGRSLVKENQR